MTKSSELRNRHSSVVLRMCTRNAMEKGVFTPEKMITQAKSIR